MFLTVKLEPRQLAEREAVRAKARAQLDEEQKTVQAKSKEGSVSIECIFVGNRPAGKGKAKAVAAEGQGGGGGPAKKDPPVVMNVIPCIRQLAAHPTPGADYRIVNATTIEFPARSSQDMKKARDALKAANTAKETALKAGQSGEKEDANIKLAETALKAAAAIVGWVRVEDGKTIGVKTFEQALARALRPLDKVRLAGVDADASMYQGQFNLQLGCSQPVTATSDASPYATLSWITDLDQVPVRLHDPSQRYGETQVFLFADYFRSNEDAECKRGCVEQKFLSNSADERDYKIVKDKEEDRLKATYCLWQKQDGSLPGYPKGDYNILAVFLEGNWTPEEQGTKNTLRKGFGINKASEFAAIMAANSIPAIIACSPNVDESNKRNAGRSHLTDNGTLVCWGNGAYFCLREYLLTQCAPVSLNYVRFVNSLPAEGAVYLQNEDTQRPCMLNRANQVKKGNQYILSGGRVLNLSEYSGNLTGLLAANPKRCEFRVLHSVPTDPETREKLAGLSTSDAEKVFNNEANAPVRLLGQNIIKIIYLVESMDDAERKTCEDAVNSWKERKAKAIAAEEAAQIAAAEAASNPTQPMDVEDQEEEAAPPGVAEDIVADAEAEAAAAMDAEIEAAAVVTAKREERSEHEESADAGTGKTTKKRRTAGARNSRKA